MIKARHICFSILAFIVSGCGCNFSPSLWVQVEDVRDQAADMAVLDSTMRSLGYRSTLPDTHKNGFYGRAGPGGSYAHYFGVYELARKPSVVVTMARLVEAEGPPAHYRPEAAITIIIKDNNVCGNYKNLTPELTEYHQELVRSLKQNWGMTRRIRLES